MTDCLDCGQKLKDNRVGLINFGDPEHHNQCPERNFPHCPNCGTDLLDLWNGHEYIGKKKIKEYRQKVIDELFAKK